MRAVGKYIVIKEIKDKVSKTKGGLLLTNNDREDIRYREGVVIIPGNEVSYIKKDDNIYFDRHAGFSVEIKSKTYIVIKEQDVVIIL
mgnify:CR=1 FL=1|tara:strand:+ start:240 stop:500 length:261 start_codon:yes stop_codon:yes gene_type:complete